MCKRFEVTWQARTLDKGFFTGSKVVRSTDSDSAAMHIRQIVRQSIFNNTLDASIKITSIKEVR